MSLNLNADELEQSLIDEGFSHDEIKTLVKFSSLIEDAAPQLEATTRYQLEIRLERSLFAKRRFIQKLRLLPPLRAAAALIALFFMSVGTVWAVNTVIQTMIQRDTGLNRVYGSGLGVELNQTVTLGQYAAELQWAYADAGRLTVGFTFSGIECVAEQYVVCDVSVQLLTQDGQAIPMILGHADDNTTVRSYLYSFDTTGFAELLDLQLVLTVYGVKDMGAVEGKPGVRDTSSTALSEPLILRFTVSQNYNVRTLSTVQSVTEQNITLTLRRVTATPSQTRLIVCFNPPTSDRTWSVIPTLSGFEADNSGMQAISDVGEKSGEICNELLYNVGLMDNTEAWRFTITELVGFGSGGGNDQMRIKGNWQFNINLS